MTNLLLTTLDALACALADHGHEWTSQERELYESAVHILTLGDPAIATETRSAETTKIGSVEDEGAVAKPIAQRTAP